MIRISDAAGVIQTTVEKAEQLAARIKMADRIYDDFCGRKEHGGQVHEHGIYVIMDDGTDRWLAEREAYAAALTTVIQSVIDGNLTDEGTEAYDVICRDCPAMYSCIGSGSYNNDEAGLLALLSETLDADDVEDIARFLGIEIPEPVNAE